MRRAALGAFLIGEFLNRDKSGLGHRVGAKLFVAYQYVSTWSELHEWNRQWAIFMPWVPIGGVILCSVSTVQGKRILGIVSRILQSMTCTSLWLATCV
jgi:hypothetical protein